MKQGFSFMENQQLTNLEAVTGSLMAGGDRSYVQSNLTNAHAARTWIFMMPTGNGKADAGV